MEAKTMKVELMVELRNVKYAKFASEETPCFEATVWIDGAKAGVVRNDGHGGADMHSPHGLRERLEAWAATLPPWKSESDGEMNAHNCETAVGGLLDDYLLRKEMKRTLASKVLFAQDGKLFALKPLSKGDMAAAIERAKARYGAAQILNALPEDAALALYKKLASA